MQIYVATQWKHRGRVGQFMQALHGAGVKATQTYVWVHGTHEDDALTVAKSEFDGVVTADVCVVLLPGAQGTHSELGMAIAAGVPTIIVDQSDKSLIWGDDGWPLCPAYLLADHRVGTEAEAIEILKQYERNFNAQQR